MKWWWWRWENKINSKRGEDHIGDEKEWAAAAEEEGDAPATHKAGSMASELELILKKLCGGGDTHILSPWQANSTPLKLSPFK